MKSRLKILMTIGVAWIAFMGRSTETLAATWPKLDGGRQRECAQALQIADSVFRSESFFLYEPPGISPSIDSRLVLRPQALDISGGDALEADKEIFDKLPLNGEMSARRLYWQKSVISGYRLAVQEAPFGWRGDQYSLFAIPESVSANEFLADASRSNKPVKTDVIVDGAWRPPLILQSPQDGHLWIITVGEPYWFLADWNIYTVETSGPRHQCTVRFRPNVKKAVDLLPKAVRHFAFLLDQTLGQGLDEGTLRPTARIRLGVQYAWANAALRPWVSGKPYNTRPEVDAGLQSWSEHGKSSQLLYLKIRRQYPLAKRTLAKYYQTRFGISAAAAQAQASYILDIAYRSHYAFHSEAENKYFRDTNPEPNPWQKR